MTPASRHHAYRNLCVHGFARGLGYIAFALHELPVFGSIVASCDPPVDAVDGSVHLLRGPGGAPVARLQWVASERAWTHYPAPHPSAIIHRPLAYTSAFFGSHGWQYVGPAEDADPYCTFYSRVMAERS